MPGRFELYCLGLPRILSPTGEEIQLGRKPLALLVYLAVEHKVPQPREHLAALLWPSPIPGRRRQSLAGAVSVLRGRLGPGVIESGHDHVRLIAGRVRADLERLEAGEILGDALTPPLEVDRFLEDFEVPDALDFEFWVDRQRARLLPATTAGLRQLTDWARRTANLRQLERYAARLLALDDLSEEGVRASMEARALAGDRPAALRVYDDWVRRLLEELGAAPSAFLEGMATRLRRRGWERPVASTIPVVRTEQWQERRFVGRAREYRILYEAWEQARQAQPRHVLILGDSGVGKTTLADRLGTAVGLEGAMVSRARCFELERGIPYAMIGAALAGLLDRPGAAATSASSLADLARVIPEVRQRYTNLPPPLEIQGEAARIRFAEAALDLLQALMEEHPVLLVIDDFHLADEASLSVLHLLMRRIQDRPFGVLMTSRPHLPEGSAHGARIRDGADYLGTVLLELAPMPPEESEALLAAILERGQARPTPSERRAILQAAGGYPMALELLARDWAEHGQESLAFSLGAMTTQLASSLEDTYRKLAESISRTLDPTARMVLHMASILDRRLNEFGMYGLVDVSVAGTMAAFAELVQRRALRDTGAGLEFANPAIRTHAYLSIPPSVRRALHDHVVNRLLERVAGGEAVPGLEIAWHCVRGGRAEEAAPHLLRGAREAMDSGAPHEAELALTSGRDLLKGDGAHEGSLLLAQVLQDLGRWEDSLAILYPLDGPDPTRRAETEVLIASARHRLGQLREEDQVTTVDRLTAIVGSDDVPAEVRVEACRVSASIVAALHRPESLQRLLGELARVPTGSGGLVRAKSLVAEAALRYHLREHSASYQCLQTAEEWLAPHLPNSSLLAMLRIGLGAIDCAQGRYTSSIGHLTRAFEAAARMDNHNLLVQASGNLALCYLRTGDYESGMQWGRLCLKFIGTTYYPTHRLLGAYCAALSHAMRGEIVPALSTIEESDAEVLGPGLGWLGQVWTLFTADVLFAVGREREALNRARASLRPGHRRLVSARHLGLLARWEVQLLLQDGQAEEAERMLADLWADVDQLDAFDRAELVVASLRVPMRRRPPAFNTTVAELDQLPLAVWDQLERLGFNRPALPQNGA